MVSVLQQKSDWLKSTFGQSEVAGSGNLWDEEAAFLASLARGESPALDSDNNRSRRPRPGRKETRRANARRVVRGSQTTRTRPLPPLVKSAGRDRGSISQTSRRPASTSSEGAYPNYPVVPVVSDKRKEFSMSGVVQNTNGIEAPHVPTLDVVSGGHLMVHASDNRGLTHFNRSGRDGQGVNELLREKLCQSVDTVDKIKRLLLTARRRRKMVNDCTVDLKQLDRNRVTPGLNLAKARLVGRRNVVNLRDNHDHPIWQEQTKHTQTQLEIFVAQFDNIGGRMEEVLEKELSDLSFAKNKIEGLVRYSEELSSQLSRIENQFFNYIKYIDYTIETDRECLAHSKVSEELPPSATNPVLTVNLEDLLPLPQLLELHEWAMQSSRTFSRTARDCWNEETSKCKQNYMASKLALRAMIRESVNLKREMEEAVLLLHNQLPYLLKKQKEIKAALASKVGPLQVCKQRYMIRVQREGTGHVDEVQEALKEEVAHLGATVNSLELNLDELKNQAQICMDKERFLKKYIEIQAQHIQLHNDFVEVETQFYSPENLEKQTKQKNGKGRTKQLA